MHMDDHPNNERDSLIHCMWETELEKIKVYQHEDHERYRVAIPYEKSLYHIIFPFTDDLYGVDS
jgi:hypothetical protein